MDDPKGKGKSRDTSEEDANSSQIHSLLSRVAASANGLTGSILMPLSSTELHDTTEAAVANSGKGQSFSSRGNDNSAWAESSKSAQNPAVRNASYGVREGHSQEHIGRSEQEFSTFLDGADSLLSTESLDIPTPFGGIDPSTGFNLYAPLEGPYRPIYTKSGVDIMGTLADINREILAYEGPGELRFTRSGFNISELRVELLEGIDHQNLPITTKTSPDQPLQRTNPSPNLIQPSTLSISEQESQDGAAVLTLLSAPSHSDFQFEPSEETPSSIDWNLSPSQITHLQAITKGLLTPPPTHSVVSPHNPLNLSPEFDDAPWETRQFQREQWENVLTGYTDEVWGDLLPLVKQARIEIKEKGQEETIAEPSSALRRLQAILGHLQHK